MKQFLVGIVVAALVVLGGSPYASAQNVNNFTIKSFDAKYTLDQDNEGRSVLRTTETIVTVFPEYDQNHGIERAIPKKYDGHSTSLKIQSVTDGSGKKINYAESTSNDNLVLRIGDADTYVHGAHTYVINYTQRDVTKFFSDTNSDEFYWDVNGTQWRQAIGNVSMGLHVSSALSKQLTGKSACYQGAQGSTDTCTISKLPQQDGTIFIADASNIGASQNMTIALGFKPHTFAAYEPSAGEKIWAVLVTMWTIIQFLSIAAFIILMIWMLVKRHKIMNRVKGRGTIIPEYLPPENTSVLVSAYVLKNRTSDVTAQIIDLAVRHFLKIYQTKDKTLFKPAEYELEIVKAPFLREEEEALVVNLFSRTLHVGTKLAMNSLKNNYQVSRALLRGRKLLEARARINYGLFEYAETDAKQFRKIGIIVLIIAIFGLSPLLLIASITAFIIAHTLWPLTEKGVALRDYLLGLKEYITVAEEDRIKMLQSPEGAEKVGVQVGENTKQLVKLYERVLPYAVLFGVEKEWTKQLGAYYEQMNSQPDWYAGNTAFNAVVFSSAVSGFSSQSSSYSSSSSSSSGGSSGGGSSGGGGGGGGGGGW